MTAPDPAQATVQAVLDGRLPLCIALPDLPDQPPACLRPIVRADLGDDHLVHALTDWRNAAMASFLGQFVATPERTRAWMQHSLLAEGGRLLFMIECGGQRVGHYGFKGLKDGDVLLDNALLGERCARGALMRDAGRALVAWLFDTLGVRTIRGEVFSTNAPALMLNRAIGFRTVRTVPMHRRQDAGQLTWVPGAPADGSPPEMHCHELLLERPAAAPLLS